MKQEIEKEIELCNLAIMACGTDEVSKHVHRLYKKRFENLLSQPSEGGISDDALVAIMAKRKTTNLHPRIYFEQDDVFEMLKELRSTHIKQPNISDDIDGKKVLENIEEDIEFGYSTEQVLNKIKKGCYDWGKNGDYIKQSLTSANQQPNISEAEELKAQIKWLRKFIWEGSVNLKFDTQKAVPPFRIGKKQKRAILDSNGHEIGIFVTGQEVMAKVFCDFLNANTESLTSGSIQGKGENDAKM